MADACEVTGYTRNQLRAMLRDLPAFACEDSVEKSARIFTRNELLAICVIARMETKHGVRRAAISDVASKIKESLQGPRPVNPNAWLKVSFEPPVVTYVDGNVALEEGNLIPLGPIFDQVDRYLGAYSYSGVQSELPLGPVILREQHRRPGGQK